MWRPYEPPRGANKSSSKNRELLTLSDRGDTVAVCTYCASRVLGERASDTDLAQQTRKRGSGVAGASTATHPVTVLVIDDDPGIRTSLRFALEDQDDRVLEAATGEAGIEVTERHHPAEFRLLCALAEAPGIVRSREELLRDVWDYDYFGDTRIVDVHIGRLRRKLEPDPATPRYVITVRGMGYKLQP
jgi:CheY-like chemotaxis protein